MITTIVFVLSGWLLARVGAGMVWTRAYRARSRGDEFVHLPKTSARAASQGRALAEVLVPTS